MSAAALAFARAAAQLVGVRFRLQGRDPATGLDCVGVVLAALGAIGRPVPAVTGYGLRNCDYGRFGEHFARAGLAPVSGCPAIGDVLQVSPGPGQMHLLVAAQQGGFVHAHAGLHQVVLSPPPLIWPISQRWRLTPN